jgi:septal ring factor EnvC (AmiA/AmiB activator)
MNGPGVNGRDAKLRESPAGVEITQLQSTSQDDGLARSLTEALGGGQVDPKQLVQFLAKRLAETERQLTQLGESLGRMNRRVSQVESRLKSLSNQAVDQEESLRMMCEVLKGLDDPYGFGQSLDERVIGDAPDRTFDGDE